jgi:hypothetical protein
MKALCHQSQGRNPIGVSPAIRRRSASVRRGHRVSDRERRRRGSDHPGDADGRGHRSPGRMQIVARADRPVHRSHRAEVCFRGNRSLLGHYGHGRPRSFDSELVTGAVASRFDEPDSDSSSRRRLSRITQCGSLAATDMTAPNRGKVTASDGCPPAVSRTWEPRELKLQRVDLCQVAAGVVVAASLAGSEPEPAARVGVAGPAPTQGLRSTPRSTHSSLRLIRNRGPTFSESLSCTISKR